MSRPSSACRPPEVASALKQAAALAATGAAPPREGRLSADPAVPLDRLRFFTCCHASKSSCSCCSVRFSSCRASLASLSRPPPRGTL
eukprot:5137999-Alexandrium_andersonii.AAC.1